ncbi:serine hydrolase domain-containing protein [Schumannella luteola]
MTVHGYADPRLEPVLQRLEAALAADPEFSFQAAAYRHGERVLDVWGGPYLGEHSVIVPFSVTKNTIGLVAGLLVQRGELDLDERVAAYWPEFAAKGKQDVTVRQLLSHQVGLPQAAPPLSWDELLDPHAAAARLADTTPLWHPGSAFGYHAVTIGTLASELVFRITGLTLQEYYEREIRAPRGIDFYLGLPDAEASRRATVLPIIPPAVLPPPEFWSVLGPVVWTHSGAPMDTANDPRSWRFGHPSTSGTGSARGLARLFASAVTGLEGQERFLTAETVATISQQQVRGYDEVLGQPHRAHAIVFQKPTPALAFGGPRAFGHDGAQGCLAIVDPDSGLAFAYTVARGPWPGGADPRALALATDIPRLLD